MCVCVCTIVRTDGRPGRRIPMRTTRFPMCDRARQASARTTLCKSVTRNRT